MLTSLELATRTIARNGVRAGLTILGILIGIAALITVTALATGVSKHIQSSMDKFASNAMTIDPENPPAGSKQKIAPALTETDAHVIADEARSVAAAAPLMSDRVHVIYGDHNHATFATGTSSAYFTIRKLVVAHGAAWTLSEDARSQKVCVLGSFVAEQLFGTADPVGATIRIERAPFRVVGVLAPQGAGLVDNPDDVVLMPLRTFRGHVRSAGFGVVDTIVVASSTASTDRARDDISSILRQRHRIRDGAADDFAITTADDLQEFEVMVAAALSALLLCIASVSLIVGGIGVMNIMLVSVAERTREIGIRISVGASSRDILMQFLVESVVLSFVGGLLGLVLGSLLSIGLGQLLDLPIQPNAVAALVATVTSATIGVVFGYLPARHAASLDPIEALRAD